MTCKGRWAFTGQLILQDIVECFEKVEDQSWIGLVAEQEAWVRHCEEQLKQARRSADRWVLEVWRDVGDGQNEGRVDGIQRALRAEDEGVEMLDKEVCGRARSRHAVSGRQRDMRIEGHIQRRAEGALGGDGLKQESSELDQAELRRVVLVLQAEVDENDHDLMRVLAIAKQGRGKVLCKQNIGQHRPLASLYGQYKGCSPGCCPEGATGG